MYTYTVFLNTLHITVFLQPISQNILMFLMVPVVSNRRWMIDWKSKASLQSNSSSSTQTPVCVDIHGRFQL